MTCEVLSCEIAVSDRAISVPITARQSVRCVPVIAGSTELVRRYRTIYQRSETRIALALKVYHSAAHGDVERAPHAVQRDLVYRQSTSSAAGCHPLDGELPTVGAARGRMLSTKRRRRTDGFTVPDLAGWRCRRKDGM